MPENVQKVVVEFNTPQKQIEAFGKLADAVNKMGGGAQTGPGKVTGTYASPEAATDAMKQMAEVAKEQKLQMGKANITQTEGGDYKVTAALQKKAFSTGGMIAGMATVVGGIGAGFAKLISLSQVFSTFMSTTGKILGTAIDLMLAPLMPIFVKIMVWIIQTVFPIATKLGNWLGGVVGDISGGGAVAALTVGYVGLKVAPAILSKLGESLGGALLSHFDADSFGSLITGGISKSVATLKDWGETAGLYVLEGMGKAKKALSTWYEAVAGGISSAFNSATSTISEWYKTVAGGISDAFSAVAGKLSGWYNKIAGGISDAFSTVTSTIGKWYDKVAGGISSAFNTVTSTIGQWYDKVAGGISSAFNTVTSTIGEWYKSVAGGISSAFNAATSTIGEWYKTVAGGISSAFNGAASTLTEWYSTVAGGISSAFKGAASTLTEWYSTVAEGITKGISKTASTLSEWGNAVGIYVTSGIKQAKGLLESWGTAVGGFISAGIKGVGGAARGTWNAIGVFIGNAISTVGAAWTKIGDAIGSALGKAGGWAKMGGMIGAGLGVVAIGGAIGYNMWKKYKEHEAGKDVFSDMLRGEAIPYIMQTYGIGEETAKKAYAQREEIGTNENIKDIYATMATVAEEVRLYGKLNADSQQELALFNKAQQDFFLKQFIPDYEARTGTTGIAAGVGSFQSNLGEEAFNYYLQHELASPDLTRGTLGIDKGKFGMNVFGEEAVTDEQRAIVSMYKDWQKGLQGRPSAYSPKMEKVLGGEQGMWAGIFSDEDHKTEDITLALTEFFMNPANRSLTLNLNMDNVPHPITRNLFQDLEYVMDDPSVMGRMGR